MSVLSETAICAYLARVLALSQSVLAQIPEQGSEQADSKVVDAFLQLVNDLNKERANDSYLGDNSWNWIWESKASINNIRLYGRLAWINLQLLELL